MLDNEDQALLKAYVFFERARRVAETGNYDYAIELYIDGLRCAPDSAEQGHIQLHSLGMVRQSKGGKKPAMMERFKYMHGKGPLESMLNAEYLFAKDPEHLPYAEMILKAATEGGYGKTAKWIADFIFQVNNASDKPSFARYVLLKDCYSKIGEFERAMVACQKASELKPQDGSLADEFKRLSAELTVSRGKYDQAGDFRQSIKNPEVQERLQAQESVVKTEDYRVSVVEQTRKKYANEPGIPQNIYNLASALADMETDEAESEAIELLEEAYKRTSDFSYQKQAGLIKIRVLKRKIRVTKELSNAHPADEKTRREFSELVSMLSKAELEHYESCVENYPTDLYMKYEYGVRLMQEKRFDEAIPLLQEAQKDPRRRVSAMNKIGMCFFLKGWFVDAIDIFSEAIDLCEIKDDSIGKELRYNLARCHEEQGENDKALELYRKLAQVDFAYMDVRERVDRLRRKDNPESTSQ